MSDKSRLEKLSEPSPEEISEAVQNLKAWINKEPHLPNIEDEEWLKTFFYNNKFSLEKTKSKLDAYYSLKNKYPRLLKNRDPSAPEMAPFWDNIHVSPKLTSDGASLVLIRHDPDPDNFVMEDHVKYVLMCLELLLLERDRLTTYVGVIDCQNFHYKHFLRVATGIRSAAEIFVGAYTERVEAIHLVNTPGFIDLALKTILPFFPEKYAKRIHIQSSSQHNLIEVIGEDTLYSNLGGKGPSYVECGEWTLKKLEQHQTWFKDQDNFCSDERLRRNDGNQFDDMKGSFRKLEVD